VRELYSSTSRPSVRSLSPTASSPSTPHFSLRTFETVSSFLCISFARSLAPSVHHSHSELYGAIRAFAGWLQQLYKVLQSSQELNQSLGPAYEQLITSLLAITVQALTSSVRRRSCAHESRVSSLSHSRMHSRLPLQSPDRLAIPAALALISLSSCVDLLSHPAIHTLAQDIPSILQGSLSIKAKVHTHCNERVSGDSGCSRGSLAQQQGHLFEALMRISLIPSTSSSISQADWEVRAQSYGVVAGTVSSSFLALISSAQFEPVSAASAVQHHLFLLTALSRVQDAKKQAKVIACNTLKPTYPAVVRLLSVYISHPATSAALLQYILTSFQSLRKEIDISFVVDTIQYVASEWLARMCRSQHRRSLLSDRCFMQLFGGDQLDLVFERTNKHELRVLTRFIQLLKLLIDSPSNSTTQSMLFDIIALVLRRILPLASQNNKAASASVSVREASLKLLETALQWHLQAEPVIAAFPEIVEAFTATMSVDTTDMTALKTALDSFKELNNVRVARARALARRPSDTTAFAYAEIVAVCIGDF